MADPFEGIPDASETFLHDILFPWMDDLAREYGLNSDEIIEDAARWLRPSLVTEYAIWIAESWEHPEPVVVLTPHGPEREPAIFKPAPASPTREEPDNEN